MGKPFSRELDRLPASIEWAAFADLAPYTQFIRHARGHPLVIVGAGGSFTVADLARMLQEARGDLAVAHTPLSFIESGADLRRSYVLIFTASGNNRDVLAAYRAASEREPLGILVVCGRTRSKVSLAATGVERTQIFARQLPTGRDGYLATNSLVAFVTLTLRAFGYSLPAPSRFSCERPAVNDEKSNHFLALYGAWARPAATDLESKFSEAGLGSVMLADFRHFAHGRHNWIDKRGGHTTVVAFITPDSENLAKKTLSLLPKSTRIIRLDTKVPGPAGVLPLLVQVFRFTEFVGKQSRIDPGRPGVPGWGAKIYHLGPQLPRVPASSATVHSSIVRKLAARGTLSDASDYQLANTARKEFIARLTEARFGALVIDFDGTVIPSASGSGTKLAPEVAGIFEKLARATIPIYFATGRGDSIQRILKESIAPQLYKYFWVSYYNGGMTRGLIDACPEPNEAPDYGLLESFKQDLLADPLFRGAANLENKGFQLTLKAQNSEGFPSAAAAIRERVARYRPRKLRVVESSHSIDVIPIANSKLDCVGLAERHLPPGAFLLTLGDRGSLDGNDFDLLTHPYSLSVDTVSADLFSCWNLLPPGCRNVAGLLYYAKRMVTKKRYFTLSFPDTPYV